MRNTSGTERGTTAIEYAVLIVILCALSLGAKPLVQEITGSMNATSATLQENGIRPPGGGGGGDQPGEPGPIPPPDPTPTPTGTPTPTPTETPTPGL